MNREPEELPEQDLLNLLNPLNLLNYYNPALC
jgi:hypothetical protein